MHPTPADDSDPIQLADWIEVEAFLQPDADASLLEIERLLRKSGTTTAQGDGSMAIDAAIEGLVADTRTEIDFRARSAGAAYPFQLDGSILRPKDRTILNWVPYLFCLVFSRTGFEWKKPTQPTARLFEEVSEAAAQAYVNGKALRFGSPRKKTQRDFRGALIELQESVGEGMFKPKFRALRPKDSRLDIAAWRDHPDRKHGKMVFFGQCGAGQGWKAKLQDLHPDIFLRQWIPDGIASPVVRGFFTPHRFSNNDELWRDYTVQTGILFDRCRTAYWAQQSDRHAQSQWPEHAQWVEDRLATFRG